MKIILIGGARPNFMKIAPLMRAIQKYNENSLVEPIRPLLVHTGQHYAYEMSQVFFRDLSLPRPDIHLGVGSGTHAEQTAKAMVELERIFTHERPDLVMVVGDENSTLGAILAAAKIGIPVAHVEAGLRAFDRSMPEEINRILTDAVADYLFTSSPQAEANLKNEGIPSQKIVPVGSVSADSLLYILDHINESHILSDLSLAPGQYILVTLHRASNVDNKEVLFHLIQAFVRVSQRKPIVFPIHPRTRNSIEQFGLKRFLEEGNVRFLEPLGYLDFIQLEQNAALVMTDSGGLQEESTMLNIPCLTLREVTEWPITVSEGTNTLVGTNTQRIVTEAEKILGGLAKQGQRPIYWDGRAAQRIIACVTGVGRKKTAC
jgi:UDP-N-acetylglucosamine 2-epimerase (non-hydrolysing)